jgi:predicted DNA-binding protein (MmcQ/YjbR family)
MARKTVRQQHHGYDRARDYILSKPDAELDYPFGPNVAVPKIRGKMFATLGEEQGNGRMNLKCDPEEAIFLRDTFGSALDGTIPNGEIERMIDNSYALVVTSLKKAERVMLETRHGKAALYPNITALHPE